MLSHCTKPNIWMCQKFTCESVPFSPVFILYCSSPSFGLEPPEDLTAPWWHRSKDCGETTTTQNVQKMEKEVKRWCFTFMNYNNLKNLNEIWQGDLQLYNNQQGEPHLKGFVNLQTTQSLCTMKNWLTLDIRTAARTEYLLMHF